MTRRAGYSLFEVLIAFVVMSLVLAALIPGQSQLLSRAAGQAERTLAHDYALSRIALMRIEPLTPNSSSEVYRDWRVTTEVIQGAAFSEEIPSFLISVTIDNQQGRQLAKVETVKAVP